MADEKVLSQADIDALLAKSGQRQVVAGVAAQQQTAPVSTSQTTSKVSQATTKIKVTPTKINTSHPAPSVPRATLPRSVPPSEVELLRATVADLRNRLDRLEAAMVKSQRVPHCDIRKIYHCDSCNSQGQVAIYTKCTNCDEENWWGWWPKK